ncbi:MAG: membrane protein insertion efficiency factor YidD [Actinomycetota bacterium]|nr:membrane protein insertion efficiency factor YidD [Actinomycetota bacterium]
MRSPLTWLLAGLVRLYRLAPRGPVPRCRFAPSCSAYALDALRLHGAVAGGWLVVRRVGRCHPFHPGGVDEVPARPWAVARAKGANG